MEDGSMRTWIIVAVVISVGIVAFSVPSWSQDSARIGAVIDVSALTKKLDAMHDALLDLKKQNEEMQKAVIESSKALTSIATSTGVVDGNFVSRLPVRWEYSFVRTRTDKLANRLGAQGWELVGTSEKDDLYLYKRPLPAQVGVEE
jgi:hypothetical protein